jgi:hypothetical protein
VSLADWSGLTPPPEVVFGQKARDLENALRSEHDLEAAVGLLDEFFLERLSLDLPQATLERALAALVVGEGRTPMVHLAEVASSSPRQLERLFARGLGLPPKSVGRCCGSRTHCGGS